jgi:hypothetical protein
MKYNIKAIETKYDGVLFRSRLEARWAAFFNLCNIPWEYEPYDFDGWIPDFVIKGVERDIFCEVKPTDKYLPEVADKMMQAMYRAYPYEEYAKGKKKSYVNQDPMECWKCIIAEDLLLLGNGPFLDPEISDYPQLGWHPEQFWFTADFSPVNFLDGNKPAVLGSVEGAWYCLINGYSGKDFLKALDAHCLPRGEIALKANEIWKKAHAEVRYNPRKRAFR